MIKINLLESVADRPAGVAFVEDKVSSTRTQTFLLALTVMALLVLGMGYDYVSANAQHETATKELERQRRINEQMIAVKREQADLEKKIGDINFRIDAIQKLRGSQQGPGAVLSELKARFDSVPGLSSLLGRGPAGSLNEPSWSAASGLSSFASMGFRQPQDRVQHSQPEMRPVQIPGAFI